MEVIAESKNLRISPRKVRLVADNLTGKRAIETVESLRFVSKKAGLPLSKVKKVGNKRYHC